MSTMAVFGTVTIDADLTAGSAVYRCNMGEMDDGFSQNVVAALEWLADRTSGASLKCGMDGSYHPDDHSESYELTWDPTSTGPTRADWLKPDRSAIDDRRVYAMVDGVLTPIDD